MSVIQPIAVQHKELGQGIVVDRISHYDEKDGGFIVRLGVSFYEHTTPAVHYLPADELEQLQVLDYPSDDMDQEEEEEEESNE